MSYESDKALLDEFRHKRELVAERLRALNPSTKEYAWEKEQLDDIDKAIKKLQGKGFMRPDPASQPSFPDKDF